jgi:hypothetical protein
VLYRDGIDHYHASYSVLVGKVDLNWRDFAGINRITETAAKVKNILSRVSNRSTFSFSFTGNSGM